MAGRGAVSAFAEHCEWTGASAEDRENWLLARRQGIGGSDAATIMGVDDFSSELALYVEKTNEGPPDEESSEVAEWGRLFEPLIIREFARRSGRKVVRGGKLMRSLKAPHYLTTLDGVQLTRSGPKVPSFARGPGVAEVKTTGYGHRYDEDLPVEVQVQIQWEMFVTGAQWATCIWLPFPERRMKWVDVEPHRAFQEVLAGRVDNFWKRVQRRLPPDPDGSEASKRALQKLYPEDSGEVIRIIGASEASDEYERLNASIKLLEQRKMLIRNTLAATMREAKYAVLEDGRYWGASFYREREALCPHCSGVIEHRASYRTYTLREPKKKNPHQPTAARRFELAEPLMLVSSPANDAQPEVANNPAE